MKVSPSGQVYVGFTAWGSVSHKYRAVIVHVSLSGLLATGSATAGTQPSAPVLAAVKDGRPR